MAHQIVIVSGRVARDPETRVTSTGTTIVNFSIPVNYKRGGEEATEWFNCKAFNKTAEFIAEYFAKGKPITVHGRLQTEEWTDKEGNERKSTWLIVDRAFFQDSPPAEQNDDEPAERPQRTSKPRNKPQQQQAGGDEGDSPPWGED